MPVRACLCAAGAATAGAGADVGPEGEDRDDDEMVDTILMTAKNATKAASTRRGQRERMPSARRAAGAM